MSSMMKCFPFSAAPTGLFQMRPLHLYRVRVAHSVKVEWSIRVRFDILFQFFWSYFPFLSRESAPS